MKCACCVLVLLLALTLTGCKPVMPEVDTSIKEELLLPPHTHELREPVILINNQLATEGLNWVDGESYDVSLYTPTTGGTAYYRLDDHSPFMSYSASIKGTPEMYIEVICKKGEEQSDIVSTEICSTPLLTTSYESGVFNQPFEFAVTCDADVYYTTNGKPPTKDSPKYIAPIDIQDTTPVKLLVCKEGFRDCAYMYYFYKDELASNCITKVQAVGEPISPIVTMEDGSTLSVSRATYSYSGGSTSFTIFPEKDEGITTYYKQSKEVKVTEPITVTVTSPCEFAFYTKKDGKKLSEHTVEFKATSAFGLDDYRCLHSEPFTQRFKSLPKDVKVFYTLNGSKPSEGSLSYDTSKGIQIRDNCILRVLVVEEGKEATYFTYPFVINNNTRG